MEPRSTDRPGHRRANSEPPAGNHLMRVASEGAMPRLVEGSLLVLAFTATVYMLVFFSGALVVFVFSVFSMYLLRPLVLLLHTSPRTCWVALQNRRFKRLRSVRFCRCAEEVDEVDWGAQQHEPLAPNSDTGLTFPVTPQQQQSPSPPESPETPGYTEDALCKLPYWMAVVLALCIFSGLLGGLGWACTIDVAHFVSRIDVYKEQASSVYDSLRDWAESHNIDLDSVWPKLEPIAEKMAEAVAIDVLQFVASFVLVLIFTVYLLMVKHDYPAGSMRDRVNFQIQRYIFLKCMICLLEGILVSTVFYCLRADLWFCWGFLTFLCNWVPNIGSIVANLAPLPVVALDPEVSIGGSRFAAVVFALTLPLVVHQTVGNYLEPKLFGNEFDLHPIIVLLALTCWSVVWGIPGAILSVPLTATIRIAIMDSDHPFAAAAVCVLEGRLGDIGQIWNKQKQDKIGQIGSRARFVRAWDAGSH